MFHNEYAILLRVKLNNDVVKQTKKEFLRPRKNWINIIVLTKN